VAREKKAHAEVASHLEKRNSELSDRVAAIETKHVEDKERRQRLLSETKARLELLQDRLPSAKEAYERELAAKKTRDAEKAAAAAKAEREASGGREVRQRAATKMQFLRKLYKDDKEQKIAERVAAKAAAEAEKGNKGGKKGKKK